MTGNGRLVTYNDDGGPGLNARLDFIYQDWLPDRATSYNGYRRRFVQTSYSGDAMRCATAHDTLRAQAVTTTCRWLNRLGNLFNGRTLRGSLARRR